MLGSTGDGTPTTPTPTLSLAGTWTGTISVPGESTGIRIISWTATQSGASASGPLLLDVGHNDAGVAQVANTTLSGTVSGSQLTSVTFNLTASNNVT